MKAGEKKALVIGGVALGALWLLNRGKPGGSGAAANFGLPPGVTPAPGPTGNPANRNGWMEVVAQNAVGNIPAGYSWVKVY